MKINFAYVAGIIDGEGTIGITKDQNGHMPYVAVANTSLPLINLLKESFGGKITIKKAHGNARESFTWTLTYNKALNFLVIITPLLFIKRKQAEVLLNWKECTPRNGKYTKHQKNEKLNLIEAMKRLNKRGV